MAGNSFVQVPPDSTGKKVDCVSLSVGGVDVFRQRICIGDGSSTFETAVVLAGKLQVGGQVSVTGSVAISNPVTLMSLTGTASVVIAAGVQHIGQVSVTGSVAISNPVTLISLTGTASVVIGAGTNNIGAVSLAAGTAKIGFIGKISATTVVSGQVSVTGSVAISNPVTVVSLTGTATMLVGGFLDPSGQQRNVVDSANLALRVNVVAGAASATLVSLTGTATMVVGGFLDPSGTQRNVVDSVNTALRVNVVAGGAGGGAVFGQVSAGASLSVTNVPVLMGGNDSVGGGIARTLLLDTSGRVILGAGANNIGQVNVSVMPAVVLAAGAANIGFINNISATLAAVLAAGTANIGTINNISAAVVLAAGAANIGVINNISATVNTVVGAGTALMGAVSLAAGTAKIGFIGKISAGIVLAAGANNIGTIQAISAGITIAAGQTVGINSISATVNIAAIVRMSGSTTAANKTKIMPWCDKFGRLITGIHPSLVAGTTQGPQSFLMTASATVVMVASGGAAVSIYVTGVMVTNGSGTMLQMKIFEGAHTASAEVVAWCAANGGGFQTKFDPPWQLSAGTALGACQVPGALTAHVMVQYYLGPA